MCKENPETKWELARSVVKMDEDKRYIIFGTPVIAKILDMDPEAVLTKIDAYNNEMSELRLGDEVEVDNQTKGIIVGFVLNENTNDESSDVTSDKYLCKVLVYNDLRKALFYNYPVKNLKKISHRNVLDDVIDEVRCIAINEE